MVPPTPMARPTRRVEIRMAHGFISLPAPQHHTQLSGRCDSGSCEAAAFGAGATASDDRASSWESASPFLNWASDWPSDRDNSGSFFAPKRKTARISATQRSCGPIIDTLPFVGRHAFASRRRFAARGSCQGRGGDLGGRGSASWGKGEWSRMNDSGVRPRDADNTGRRLRDDIRRVMRNGGHSCDGEDDVVVIGVIPEAGNPRRVCWTGVSERRQHHHSCEEQRRERTPTPHGPYNTPTLPGAPQSLRRCPPANMSSQCQEDVTFAGHAARDDRPRRPTRLVKSWALERRPRGGGSSLYRCRKGFRLPPA